MKRTALALALILALALSLVAGMQCVKVARADPFFIFKPVDPVPGTIPPTITILSPQNNTIYSPNKITVSFNVSKPQLASWESSIIDIEYTLDNATAQVFSMWNQESAGPEGIAGIPEFNTTFTLPSLPTGNHNLTVSAEGVELNFSPLEIFYINSSSTTFFTVGTPPPSLKILEIWTNYTSSQSVPLNFTINEPATWMAYDLDNQANITIIGNTTLRYLPDGSHNLTVYANDTAGNTGVSNTVYFTITKPAQSQAFPTASPTINVVLEASVVVLVVMILAIINYKRKNAIRQNSISK